MPTSSPRPSVRSLGLDAAGTLTRDLVHAARALAKARTFTLVSVLSLGIGMGAVVALATFNRALTAPARGINPDGLTELLVLPLGPLRARAGEWALEVWSYPDFQALRNADLGLTLTGWSRESSRIGVPTPDAPSLPRVATLYVSANYFDTFGVALARGPGFDAALDDAPLGEPRVVVSHGFWQIRMAANPEAIGTSLTIDGVPHTVVGIAPPDFDGHFHFFQAPSSLLFVPLERHPRLRERPDLRHDRTADWIRIHGRLDPGVPLPQARERVAAVMSGLAAHHPETNAHKAATVQPYVSLGAVNRPESLRAFNVLLALAGAVLLIVCLNLSGMMLVRAASRERELSVRAALGAGRSRLVQHLFAEALLLACAAGTLSVFVLFGIPALAAWWIGVPVPREVDFDAVSAAISGGLCLLVSLLFGLAPAVRFSRPALLPALKEDAGGGRRHTIRVHRFAATAQVAVAIPFLVTSGVMLDRVRTADFGFATEGLAAARMPAPPGTGREAHFTLDNIRDGLRQASGVRTASLADGMPVDFDYRLFRVARANGPEFVTAHVTRVDEYFLDTLGVPLDRGRAITAVDRVTAAPVAIVSESLAERLFPGTEALGEQITLALEAEADQAFTVVGVTADFATSQLTTERPQILLPLPEALPASVYVIARGVPGDEARLEAALERALHERSIDALPGEVFRGIVTGQDLVEKSRADLIAESTAVGVAGNLVLVLAALGIVGVVGFMVATRTREIAVRMALGSTRRRVFGLMLTDTVKLVVPGVAGGLVLAAALIRTMEEVMGTPLRLGPEPLGVMEPLIYAAASALAVAAALLAGLPAARRATAIQPMVAMRTE